MPMSEHVIVISFMYLKNPEETSKRLAGKNALGSQLPIGYRHAFLSHSFPCKGCGGSQLRKGFDPIRFAVVRC